MTILRVSISSTIMIVAILIMRWILLNKLPKKTFLVLWYASIFRLFMPFQLPFEFSFFTIFSNTTNVSSLQHTNSTMQNDIVEFSIPLISKIVNLQPTATTSLVFIAWFIGAISFFAFFTITHLRCKQTYQMALPIDNPAILEWQMLHPLKRSINIKQSDKINAPLTYGVLHPVVLLPMTIDYSDKRQLQYVLAHEYTHIKHFDIVCKWLLMICLCVHWFNPFVWIMHRLANRDIEICCDESVVFAFGIEAKFTYASSLIQLEEKRCMRNNLCSNFSKNPIEERIKAIMKIRKRTVLSLVLSIILVVATTSVFATSAKESYSATNVSNAKIDELYFSENSSPVNTSSYTFEQLKAWLENFKVESTKAVANGTRSKELADIMVSRYIKKISQLENIGGVIIGKLPEESNEIVNVFYNLNQLVFQIPENVFELDINSPMCILKIFPKK